MSDVYSTLKRYFGYDTFRPMQEDIITHVVAGGDALVLMPTGGGKSLCFQMAALMREGTAIVVSPLISLMKDQVQAARANGIAAVAYNSAASAAETEEIISNCRSGKVKLLYLSPERLLGDLSWIRTSLRVSLFAIDEAHCISAWGHDFRPEYTRLDTIRSLFPDVPIMALTATADKITRSDIIEQLRIPQARLFVGTFDRPNISLTVLRGYSESERRKAILALIRRHRGESGIVYCISRKNTAEVASYLSSQGIRAAAYHAGLPTDERNKVQESFVNDSIQVVCATIAFGMGIDKSNVRFVVHYNMPRSIENYYQEIGRGGRDGLPCETILFYNLQDLIVLRHFVDESGQREINYDKLRRMQEYAEASVCRRRILLNYFSEPRDCNCNNCDVCHNPPTTYDGTVAVQKVLSAIKRCGEQVSTTIVIDILKGTFSPEVVERGFQSIKTFGAGSDTPARIWRDILLQMLLLGYIEVAYNEHHHLRVTPLGDDVLYGRASATLVRVESAKSRKSDSHSQMAPNDDVSDDTLLAKLRVLRRRISVSENIPAYMVVSDATLLEIEKHKPTNLAAFNRIKGIGLRKLQAYGTPFINVVREYMMEHGLPINDDEAVEVDTPKPRNYIVRHGVRYDIDLDIWQSIDWRKVLTDINNIAYWNYISDRRLPLSSFVSADLPERGRIVQTLAKILSSAYDINVDIASDSIFFPVRRDYDTDGNELFLPDGTTDELISRFDAFLQTNGRFPMLDGPRDEAALRKWYRHAMHGLIPFSDEQSARFAEICARHSALPKTNGRSKDKADTP